MKGTGKAIEPYIISSIVDMEVLRDKVNSGELEEEKVHVKLVQDITLIGRNWSPIGNERYPFRGCFDGDGHLITQMKIQLNQKDYIGLFGIVEYSEIKNIGIIDCLVHGREYVGGLVGKISANSTVEKCFVKGTIIMQGSYGGGLIGYADYYNYIRHCYASISIEGEGKTIGGIVGYNGYKSVVEHCYTEGEGKMQKGCLGGIVGYNGTGSSIRSCYSIMRLKGESFIGGIVGKSEKHGETQSEKNNTTNCIALNEAIEGSIIGRISGEESGMGINYAFLEMLVNGQYQKNGTLLNKDGEDLTREAINTEVTYLTKEFNYGNGWILRQGKLPILVGLTNQQDEMVEHLKNLKIIHVVSLAVNKLIVGEKLQQTFKTHDTNYSIQEVRWEPAHTMCIYSTAYKLMLYLEAKAGYAFEETEVFAGENQEAFINRDKAQKSMKLEIRIDFEPIILPEQQGEIVFRQGNPPRIDVPVVVDARQLKITSRLVYRWYRSTTDSKVGIDYSIVLSTNQTYQPTVEDIGKYLVVEVTTPDALGEVYQITEEIKKYPYVGEVLVPVVEDVTSQTIRIKKIKGYEYALGREIEEVPKIFRQEIKFGELEPYTDYIVYQRLMETAKEGASSITKKRVYTNHIIITKLYGEPSMAKEEIGIGDAITLPESSEVRTNVEGMVLRPMWQVYDVDNHLISVDGVSVVEEDKIYIYKATLSAPTAYYFFDKTLETRTGVKITEDGKTITYTFIVSQANKSRREEKIEERSKEKVDTNETAHRRKMVNKATEEIELQESMRALEKNNPNHMGVWNLRIRS
ncbi:MAG: GLUG motif-containing protein [Cellulosilyticaceae bacterium]